MAVLLSLFLAGFVLLGVSLQRAYTQVPVKELQRRARQKDPKATQLHQAAAYGASLNVFLWLIVGLASAIFFVFVARHFSGFVAVLCSGLLLTASFRWLPNRDAKQISMWFASTLAPAFAWLLHYIHAPLSWLVLHTRKFLTPRSNHTGIYDKQDFLDIINDQKDQPGNRISETDLELVSHALMFGEKLVSDHMTPRRAVKAIGINDSIGPILMSELHDSGFSRFPVYEGKKDNIVGTLFLKDLVNTKATAKVRDVMRKAVCYVHEDQSLHDALQAILKTHHHLLVVVNDFEDYVGILTIEDVLEQVIGKAIIDEFDQYEDIRAVAQRAALKEHKEHKEVLATSEVATEVVE